MVCYPTFGGSGVVATELGKALATQGYEIHFITYHTPVRLGSFKPGIFYHEVKIFLLNLSLPMQLIRVTQLLQFLKT